MLNRPNSDSKVTFVCHEPSVEIKWDTDASAEAKHLMRGAGDLKSYSRSVVYLRVFRDPRDTCEEPGSGLTVACRDS